MGEHCDQCQVTLSPDPGSTRPQVGRGPSGHPQSQILASALTDPTLHPWCTLDSTLDPASDLNLRLRPLSGTRPHPGSARTLPYTCLSPAPPPALPVLLPLPAGLRNGLHSR